ncbi:ATP-binding protein [Candidatus Woesearchaeota archaeon]|nr:ATP-binding protein [Candidatus Woesearchaeota archaeon]
MVNLKESDKVELKTSLSQLEKSLKTVCAFTNHKGGTIYFGIDDKTRNSVGQIATDSNLKKISQQIKTATRDLNDLVDKNILKKVGTTGKGTYYVIGDIKGTSKETPF